MSNNTYIYILRLHEDKYYIGRTGCPKIRINKHYTSYGSAWTNKYKPIETLEVIPDCDHFDEDKITKQYMAKYGIDNVRGGSYCQIELLDGEKKFILKEIQNVNDVCYKCGSIDHFINRCPLNIKENKKDENTINISDFNFIENVFYENDFIGIVNMNETLPPPPRIHEDDTISSNYDKYMIEDTDSDSDTDTDSETEEPGKRIRTPEYLAKIRREYDEFIDDVNDKKCIFSLFKDNKKILVSVLLDTTLLITSSYYLYRTFK